MESLSTQSLVIFAIRTRKVPFFRSRPGKWLALATIVIVGAGLVLTYLPDAPFLGFTPLPVTFLGILVGMIAVYIVLVEIAKSLFYSAGARARRERRPHLPMAHFELAAAEQALQRLASRWTVRVLRRT